MCVVSGGCSAGAPGGSAPGAGRGAGVGGPVHAGLPAAHRRQVSTPAAQERHGQSQQEGTHSTGVPGVLEEIHRMNSVRKVFKPCLHIVNTLLAHFSYNIHKRAVLDFLKRSLRLASEQ